MGLILSDAHQRRGLIGIGLDPRYLVPEPVRAIIQETECYAEEPKENILG